VTPLHTEALVLRAVDFGESDRIVHLLTPATGRLTAIAKGARRSAKRFPGTLDFFNHLAVQVDRRRPTAMARLDHARLRRTFHAVRESSARFALGCYLLEMLDRLAPEGGTRTDLGRLFRFALGALEQIDALEPDLRLRTLLELRALDALGLRPELGRCVGCGEPVGAGGARGAVAFHVADGGPLCRRCTREGQVLLPVHVGTLRALEQGLRLDLDRIGRLALGGAALREARTLLTRFLRFHVGLELRSERFLDERLTLPGAKGTLRPPVPPACE
jgi:DNA repair protein RecO (recombination protein O)